MKSSCCLPAPITETGHEPCLCDRLFCNAEPGHRAGLGLLWSCLSISGCRFAGIYCRFSPQFLFEWAEKWVKETCAIGNSRVVFHLKAVVLFPAGFRSYCETWRSKELRFKVLEAERTGPFFLPEWNIPSLNTVPWNVSL